MAADHGDENRSSMVDVLLRQVRTGVEDREEHDDGQTVARRFPACGDQDIRETGELLADSLISAGELSHWQEDRRAVCVVGEGSIQAELEDASNQGLHRAHGDETSVRTGEIPSVPSELRAGPRECLGAHVCVRTECIDERRGDVRRPEDLLHRL